MSTSNRSRLHKGEEKTDINISPMIDMVFILLIFFIVTTVFVEEEGLGVDKPTPAPPEPDKPEEKDEPVMLRVTATGQVVYKKNSIPLSRVETIVKTALSQADVPVIMQVERGALSGLMVQVMDQAKIGGADKISVTAVD
ncbi:MAG: ExbD/TolR family protein [Puniceicoccaceae bacterium]